jgi:hypothetical protein
MSTDDGVYEDALQAALAGEHAAVWASGRAAGQLRGAAREAALSELDEHRRARDELRRQLVALDVEPVEAAPAYVEPFRIDGRGPARRLMRRISAALTVTYAELAAAGQPASRREAAAAATKAARRAIDWGSDAEAFPGTDT